MEGCRRIDEWELIFEQLGSLERVPHLAYGDHVDAEGRLTLTAEEWRVVVHIDGRADINTDPARLRPRPLPRRQGHLQPVLERPHQRDRAGDREHRQGPERRRARAHRHLQRGVPQHAHRLQRRQAAARGADRREGGRDPGGSRTTAGERQRQRRRPGRCRAWAPAEDVLVFTAASTCPEQAWKRLAGESSAWVLLANANDVDSLRSTRADLEFVKTLGKVPYVVATYMSMAGEELRPSRSPGRSASTRRRRCCRASCATASPSRAWSGRRWSWRRRSAPAERRRPAAGHPPVQRRLPLVFAAPRREDCNAGGPRPGPREERTPPHVLPQLPHEAPAPHPRHPGPGARDEAPARRPRLPAVRHRRRERQEPHLVDAGLLPALHRQRAARGARGRRARHQGDPAVRHPGAQGRRRHRRLRPRGHRADGRPRHQGRVPGARDHHRRLPLRVHGPWPLRRGPGG